jgi:glycosyltransferase involved in cell wall biosynthesis
MAMLTVVLSNFNHARFLPDCLEALLGQTRPADELIIIDDASADDSVAVISSFLARFPSARLLRNPLNLGCVPNMNRGLEMARGDIVYFAAADDVTYPTLFEKGMALLEAHPEAAIFSARSRIIDAFGNDKGILATPVPLTKPGFIGPSQVAHKLMRDDGWFLGQTTLFRLRSLQGAAGFPADLGAFADGYISGLLALKHGVCFSPQILAAWRRMEGGMAWSRTTNLDGEAQFIALVERKMSEAGGWFPSGYSERWKRRYIFGARRFRLVQVRRKAASAGTLAYFRALAAEALFTAWSFLTLRPWDIAAVFQRRFRYLVTLDRIGKFSAVMRRSQSRRGVFDRGKSV